jgi:phospholipid/cholesterol/gamma-HCH transport system substrate-binding protein
METRANYALIGLFTLLVVASAFGFVYWFSGGDRGQARQAVRIIFNGSVAGLTKGSGVLFNGIRVGEVTEINLLPEDPRRVVSLVEVDRNTPVRTDTRARLEYQGLTGVAQIAFIGGEPSAPVLTPGPGQSLPTIFADRSDFQDLIETARNIARRADDVLEKVAQVVTDNQGSISRTVQNVERFSQALGDNSAGIDRFLEQVGQAAERIGPLAEKLETLAANLDEVIRAVDRDQVASIVANVDSFARALGENRQVLSDTLKDAGSLVRQLNEAAPKLDAALADIGEVAKAIDATKLGRTIDNVDRFAESLGRTGGDVEKTVTEARQMVEKLNKSADRVDGVLAAAEGFLGSASGEAGKGAFDEVRDAARSIRALADNLDKRTAEITAGVNKFTGAGLREYEALAVEGRKAVNDISRAVKNLERNPQQLIFGGQQSIPQYNGRR